MSREPEMIQKWDSEEAEGWSRGMGVGPENTGPQGEGLRIQGPGTVGNALE